MKEIKISDKILSLEKPLIMGILNVTPDSFSDGGEFIDIEKAVLHAKEMIKEGADIIDIGGESSRPGSDPVSEEEELNRVKPIIERLVKEVDVPISIDTYKPMVAEECLKAGATIINDITGVDERMRKVAAKYGAAVIIMHMSGAPKTMQENIHYEDVISDIKLFLKERAEKAKEAGITSIMIDPGIGFGKTTEQNLEIIRRLNEFEELGYPILMGISRKSFIGKVLGLDNPKDRFIGTIISNIIAVENGAIILRVHDIKGNKQALDIAGAILRGKNDYYKSF